MSLSLVLAMVFGSRLLEKRFRCYSYGTILAVFVGAFLAGQQAPQIGTNQRHGVGSMSA
jgi:hypothetical protein